MLQSIKSQVQHQINGIAQDQGAVGVDESGRAIRRYEQCETILKNILDRPEYSGKLSDVELCRRICRSVGVEFDDSLSASPGKCIEMVASAVVDYVGHEVVDGDTGDTGFISSDDKVKSVDENESERSSTSFEKVVELQSNELSHDAGGNSLPRARCFPLFFDGGPIHIMGSRFPGARSNAVDFVFDTFGSVFVLMDSSDGDVQRYFRVADRIRPEFFQDSGGGKVTTPDWFCFDPIDDYSIPTLSHFIHLSAAVRASCSKGENVLVCCGYGGGRTGTMLAAVKLLHGFSRLDAESKTVLPNMKRNFHVENYNGTFKDLDHSHRTTENVHDVVVELRESEKDFKDGAVSVETPDQFLTLELWRLLLSINHRVKLDKEVSDDQIKEWIVDAGFSDDFLEQFGKNNEIGEDGEALSGLDYIVRTARSLQL